MSNSERTEGLSPWPPTAGKPVARGDLEGGAPHGLAWLRAMGASPSFRAKLAVGAAGRRGAAKRARGDSDIAVATSPMRRSPSTLLFEAEVFGAQPAPPPKGGTGGPPALPCRSASLLRCSYIRCVVSLARCLLLARRSRQRANHPRLSLSA